MGVPRHRLPTNLECKPVNSRVGSLLCGSVVLFDELFLGHSHLDADKERPVHEGNASQVSTEIPCERSCKCGCPVALLAQRQIHHNVFDHERLPPIVNSTLRSPILLLATHKPEIDHFS